VGLKDIQGTALYTFLLSCIPAPNEIQTRKVFIPHELSVMPRYMKTLGTMCDYGVRARNQYRDFGYVQKGLRSGRYKEDSDLVETLLDASSLSATEAYLLVTGKYPGHLANAFYKDYNILTERAISMYRLVGAYSGFYGLPFSETPPIGKIECDCVFSKGIADMKVSRTSSYNREYWVQLMLYTFIARSRDNLDRRCLYLLYPVQGDIKYFIYPEAQYRILFKVFQEVRQCT